MSADPNSLLPKRLLPRQSRAYDGQMEARIAVLEEIARATRETLGRLDTRLDRMEQRMEEGFQSIRSEIKDVRGEMKDIHTRQERDFRLVFGALITAAIGLAGMIVGLAGVMAHGFHWF